jgi:hypothetical protein
MLAMSPIQKIAFAIDTFFVAVLSESQAQSVVHSAFLGRTYKL